jgi:hypothetical protein
MARDGKQVELRATDDRGMMQEKDARPHS